MECSEIFDYIYITLRKASGFNILLELITLAHLHTSRAVIPTQTQAIEGFDIEKGHKREWYYRKEAKDRNGPVGFSELKDLSWLRASHGGMADAAAGNDTSHYPRQVPQMHLDV